MFSRAIHKTSNSENTQGKYIQSTRVAVFTMYRYSRHWQELNEHARPTYDLWNSKNGMGQLTNGIPKTLCLLKTRKLSWRCQTRATWKSAKNCSNSTCLQRFRWRYWPIFIRLAVVASEICEIQRNSLKIQTYGVQGHPRSSILVSMESPYVTSY